VEKFRDVTSPGPQSYLRSFADNFGPFFEFLFKFEVTPCLGAHIFNMWQNFKAEAARRYGAAKCQKEKKKETSAVKHKTAWGGLNSISIHHT